MKKYWAVVANSSYAKILEVKGMGKEIHEIKHISFPDGRKKGRELTEDRPGRTFDSQGHGRHGLGTRVDPHEHEVELFAKQLCDYLHKAKAENQYEELAIVAPAHFLGELGHHFTDIVKHAVIKKVHKDLPEDLSGNERIEMIAKYLDLWNR